MKILLIILFTGSISFAEPYQSAITKISDLQNTYSSYIYFLTELPHNNNQIKALEKKIIRQHPNFTFVSLIGDHSLDLYTLDLYRELKTNNEPSTENKLYHAQTDRAKLNAFLFVVSNLQTFYTAQQQKSDRENYKILFKNSELQLLSLAKKALDSPTQEAEILSTEFNLIIQQLSRIPFPPEFSYYRRRIMFTLDTPRAAEDQILRISDSLKNIK